MEFLSNRNGLLQYGMRVRTFGRLDKSPRSCSDICRLRSPPSSQPSGLRLASKTKPSTRSIMKQNFNKTLVATPVTNSLVFGETAEAVLESYSASQSNNNSNTKLH